MNFADVEYGELFLYSAHLFVKGELLPTGYYRCKQLAKLFKGKWITKEVESVSIDPGAHIRVIE